MLTAAQPHPSARSRRPCEDEGREKKKTPSSGAGILLLLLLLLLVLLLLLLQHLPWSTLAGVV